MSDQQWDEDSWGIVINGPKTYRAIANYWLTVPNSVVINWTDCRGTALVILFTMGANADDANGMVHTFHPGLPMNRVMFVGIMRCGCFGFDILDGLWVSPDYVEEKLGVYGATAEAISHLINGVKTAYTGKPHEPKQASPQEAESDREDVEIRVEPPA